MAQEVVEAPIPGKIISVKVKAGDAISEDDTICEIESMKMENPINAPVSGTVSKISVTEGDVVKTGQELAVIDY